MSAQTPSEFRRAGVMGWPVKHSLSPVLHGYWLKLYDIQGEYVHIPVAPEDFAAKVKDLKADGFVGCNVTVPHKEAALRVVDELAPLAEAIGAVNTIVVREDGSLYGTNTDGFGFLENIRQFQPDFDPASGPAVVLGAGGAARAILAALMVAGAPKIHIVNRTLSRAQNLVRDLDRIRPGCLRCAPWENRGDVLSDAALLVNTTTLGMTGQDPLEMDLSALSAKTLVTDIVYNPLETDLLKAAKARGNPTVDGLGMLLHQARPGFEAWFGVLPDVTDDLRQHVLKAMGS